MRVRVDGRTSVLGLGVVVSKEAAGLGLGLGLGLGFGFTSVLALGVVVSKEADGRGHERLSAHELGLLLRHRLASLAVERACIEAEPEGLQLALAHRQQRIAEGEARADVGTSRDGGEDQVGLDVAVDVPG